MWDDELILSLCLSQMLQAAQKAEKNCTFGLISAEKAVRSVLQPVATRGKGQLTGETNAVKETGNDDHERVLKSPFPAAIFRKDLCVSPQFLCFQGHLSGRHLCTSHFSGRKGSENGAMGAMRRRRRRKGKDGRDERGSAIHLTDDCVQLDVGENLSQVNR